VLPTSGGEGFLYSYQDRHLSSWLTDRRHERRLRDSEGYQDRSPTLDVGLRVGGSVWCDGETWALVDVTDAGGNPFAPLFLAHVGGEFVAQVCRAGSCRPQPQGAIGAS